MSCYFCLRPLLPFLAVHAQRSQFKCRYDHQRVSEPIRWQVGSTIEWNKLKASIFLFIHSARCTRDNVRAQRSLYPSETMRCERTLYVHQVVSKIVAVSPRNDLTTRNCLSAICCWCVCCSCCCCRRCHCLGLYPGREHLLVFKRWYFPNVVRTFIFD